MNTIGTPRRFLRKKTSGIIWGESSPFLIVTSRGRVDTIVMNTKTAGGTTDVIGH